MSCELCLPPPHVAGDSFLQLAQVGVFFLVAQFFEEADLQMPAVEVFAAIEKMDFEQWPRHRVHRLAHPDYPSPPSNGFLSNTQISCKPHTPTITDVDHGPTHSSSTPRF